MKNKVKIQRNGRTVEVANPLFKASALPRGAMYYRHTSDDLVTMVVCRDNRVSAKLCDKMQLTSANRKTLFQIFKAVYSITDLVDELTTCSRKLKGKGKTPVLQPLIAQQFNDFMGGVDVA